MNNKLQSEKITQILESDPVNYRPEEVYVVSEILDSKSSRINARRLRCNLFNQLPFSEMEWKKSLNSEDFPKIYRYRKALLKYEKLLLEKASKESMEEFDSFKQIKLFGNIELLNRSISAKLKKSFNFENYYKKGSDSNKKEINREFLIFYNFINNSQILPANKLRHLLYLPSMITSSSKVGQLGFQALGMYENKEKKSAMIGISLGDDWFNYKKRALEFKSGFSVTERFFYAIFVHEFAHALDAFYCLDSKWRAVLNLNIIDFEPTSTKDYDIEEMIRNHFEKMFRPNIESLKNLSNRRVINSALEFFWNNIEKNKKISDKQIRFIWIKWLVVPSRYGRTPIISSKTKHPQDEWFAEGFAYYYGTLQADRNKIWELWLQFFTKVLPALGDFECPN